MVNSPWFVVRRGGGRMKMEFFSCEGYDRGVNLRLVGPGEASLAGRVTVYPAASCIRPRLKLSVVQCANSQKNVSGIDWEK